MPPEVVLPLVQVLVAIVVIWLVIRMISFGVAGGIKRAKGAENASPLLPSSGFPIEPVGLSRCENCGSPIGKLETPSVWNQHIVCGDCHRKLSATP